MKSGKLGIRFKYRLLNWRQHFVVCVVLEKVLLFNKAELDVAAEAGWTTNENLDLKCRFFFLS